MKNTLKISLVQTDIAWEDIDANLLHLNDLIYKVDSDTDIVILPEMFSTGFSMETEKLAEDFEGKTLRWMRSSAERYDIALTGSLIFRQGSKIYNRLIWMNPSGTFSYYDKRHLFRMSGENEFFSAGNSKLIIEYHGWKFCPMVCYDLRFPVWSRNKENYDVLIYIANWPAARSFAWNTLLRARAIENQCYVAAVNRVGMDGWKVEYSGESMILDPMGTMISQMPENNETIISASLDFETLNDFKKKFPVNIDADDYTILI